MIIYFHLDFDGGWIFIVLIISLEPWWIRLLGTMNRWLRWCDSISAAVPQIISQIIPHDHPVFSLGPRLVVELVLQWRAVGIGKDSSICHLFQLILIELFTDEILFGQDFQGIHKVFVYHIDLLFLDPIETGPMDGGRGRTGTSLVARFSA